MANFAPISALSLEDVNVLWAGKLAGNNIDPTGQTEGQAELTPQMAFPVSSGNVSAPAEPSVWYTGSWLLGATLGDGNMAQVLVGPSGGVVTLTAGTTYDVWARLTGGTEVPVQFVGQLPVY